MHKSDVLIERMAVLGVGMVGGSLAMALKQAGAVGEVIGTGRRRAHLDQALALGAIDRVVPDPARAIAGTDLVVVATPVGASAAMFEVTAAGMVDGTVVTDVGSVKQSVVAAARAALGDRARYFVPGHPIAGTERSGVGAAQATLFRGRRTILTPDAGTDAGALSLVRRMWQAVGAEVVEMSAERHDAVLAATSHLPHMLAYCLVDWLAGRDGGELFGLSAGGFYDFTRIASSDPQMWRDICLANRDPLLALLKDYGRALEGLSKLIEANDGAGLLQYLDRAKAARDRYLPADDRPHSRRPGPDAPS